jgi:hypothetical protein
MEFSSEMAPAFAQAFDEMARDTDNFEVFSDNFYSDEEIIRGIDENI